MMISIEALAMAGADYTECDIDCEEWERDEIETTPPYLLADDDEEDDEDEEEEVIKEIKFQSANNHPLWPCLSHSSFSSLWDESSSSSSSTSDSDDDEAEEDEFSTVACPTYESLAGIIKKMEKVSTGEPKVATEEDEDSHSKVIEDDTLSTITVN
ncbi:hypothetical protein BVC80_715g67 [Macleaya cordata]|uniref:Uncharacterized protein n=1 Tax=Macleaya cordata TaxID=56857 RepID=A0A200PMD3_MACCD|nr:hypothetical protein BVC80_715g67 [Macleaya cordata]